MNQTTKIKLVKILKGALIAGGGAALTYFLDGIGNLDFGTLAPVVAAIAAVLINAVKEAGRKYDK